MSKDRLSLTPILQTHTGTHTYAHGEQLWCAYVCLSVLLGPPIVLRPYCFGGTFYLS